MFCIYCITNVSALFSNSNVPSIVAVAVLECIFVLMLRVVDMSRNLLNLAIFGREPYCTLGNHSLSLACK